MIISVITTLLGVATFFTVASPYILPVIQNRNLWAAVSLITILLFTSGQMFNHIRKVPYVSGDGQGGISYFAPGFSNQFGIETQIVAAMCKFLFARTLPCDGLLIATFYRWCSGFRNDCTGIESPTNGGSEDTTNRSHHLGVCYPRDVQFPDEHLQSQERRLSVLATTFLRRPT